MLGSRRFHNKLKRVVVESEIVGRGAFAIDGILGSISYWL
jgi:hypothetical protein